MLCSRMSGLAIRRCHCTSYGVPLGDGEPLALVGRRRRCWISPRTRYDARPCPVALEGRRDGLID